jgi:outer membrane protein assembly factor BamD (BamD/ComL family)
MLKNWKKLLVIFIIAAVFYGACNTKGILVTENFFRVKNPKLGVTPNVCYMLGTAAFRSFRYKLAIDIIDRNLKQFPYKGAAQSAEYRRAVCYEKLANYDMAIAKYEEFMYRHPKDNRYKSIQTKVVKLKALHQED